MSLCGCVSWYLLVNPIPCACWVIPIHELSGSSILVYADCLDKQPMFLLMSSWHYNSTGRKFLSCHSHFTLLSAREWFRTLICWILTRIRCELAIFSSIVQITGKKETSSVLTSSNTQTCTRVEAGENWRDVEKAESPKYLYINVLKGLQLIRFFFIRDFQTSVEKTYRISIVSMA